MIFAVNVLVVLLLSLVPGGKSRVADPHGFRSLTDDSEIRRLLTEGRLGEFDAAVEGFVMTRLMIDAKAGAQPRALAAQAEAASLLGLIKLAAKAATLAAELKTLGPRLGLKAAISWVESGLLRRTGLRRADFPSLFSLLARPELPEIPLPAFEELGRDYSSAQGVLNGGYERLLGMLREQP